AITMLVFFPLGIFAIILSPLISLLNKQPVVLPTATNIVAVFAILGAYFLSRSKYYSVGAWIAIAIPVVAIVWPAVSTGVALTVAAMFFLALSVILAGLLLSSNETFLIGGILIVVVLLLPSAGPTSTGGSQSVNISVSLFILITTILTVSVGRGREQ